MTIRQQGGVFGRNPTFNNVNVEGTLTVNGEPISDFGTMAQQDADSVNIDGGAIDGVTLGTNSAVTEAQIDNININGSTIDSSSELFLKVGGNDGVRITDTNRLGINTIPYHPLSIGVDGVDAPVTIQMRARNLSGGDSPVGEVVTAYDNPGGSNGSKLVMRTRDGSGVNDGITIRYNSNVEINRGNLVMANGQGIDFSATSGTGTSELFDDYEEGTWTPQYTNTTPPTTPYTMDIVSADYVKIGSTVIVTANIRTDNVDTTGAIGALRVSGLPFACGASSAAVFVGSAVNWGGDFPSSGYVNPSSTQIILRYRTAANGVTSESNAADLTTGAVANQNVLLFSAIYTV